MKLPEPIEEFLYEPPVAPVIWPRRLFHLLLGSTLPIGILLLPIDLSEWLLIAASMAAVLAEVLRGLLQSVNDWMVRRLPFFKASERWQITGATYMWLSATFLVFVFDKDIAVLALLFLSVGDPVAALIGVRDHRARLFGKSLVGSAAFASAASVAGCARGVARRRDAGLVDRARRDRCRAGGASAVEGGRQCHGADRGGDSDGRSAHGVMRAVSARLWLCPTA